MEHFRIARIFRCKFQTASHSFKFINSNGNACIKEDLAKIPGERLGCSRHRNRDSVLGDNINRSAVASQFLLVVSMGILSIIDGKPVSASTGIFAQNIISLHPLLCVCAINEYIHIQRLDNGSNVAANQIVLCLIGIQNVVLSICQCKNHIVYLALPFNDISGVSAKSLYTRFMKL